MAHKVLEGQYWYQTLALENAKDESDYRAMLERLELACRHGYNGVAVGAKFAKIDARPPVFFERLKEIKRAADEKGIAVIPAVGSCGYGHTLLEDHDRNLAAGLEIKRRPLLIQEGRAVVKNSASIYTG